MGKRRIAILTLLLIGAAGTVVLWGIWHQKRAAVPETIVNQIKNMPQPLPNVEIVDAAWANGRIVVQAQFLGFGAEAPRSSYEWHQLAQSCAQRIYLELEEQHAVEVQLFHDDEFRAVSVAGL